MLFSFLTSRKIRSEKNRQQLFTTYAVNKTKHIKGVKGNRGANEGETGD